VICSHQPPAAGRRVDAPLPSAPGVGGVGANAGGAGGGGAGGGVGEALSFKVMRLNRPNFYTAAPSVGLSLLGVPQPGGASVGIGNSNTLCFAAGFGNIYLGETFQAYVSACNNGGEQLARLEVRAEIQTGTKRLPLLDAQTPNSLLASFGARQCVDYVVSHELKEAGVHIMICSATYLEASGQEKKVRQYFKFQVQKPLSVTTKLHMLNKTILLENQIQNMTKAPLSLDAIKFEPTPHYTREDLTAPTTDTVFLRDPLCSSVCCPAASVSMPCTRRHKMQRTKLQVDGYMDMDCMDIWTWIAWIYGHGLQQDMHYTHTHHTHRR